MFNAYRSFLWGVARLLAGAASRFPNRRVLAGLFQVRSPTAMTKQDSSDSGLPAVTPMMRKRLQQLFERANRLMGQADHDYAHELFSQCVIADPGNVVYTQTCLANLIQKHGGKKKTSMFSAFKGLGSKGGAKKAALKKNWMGVIKSGLEVLSKNPWDTLDLLFMAEACEGLGLLESQLVYLRAASNSILRTFTSTASAAAAFRERDYAGGARLLAESSQGQARRRSHPDDRSNCR